MATITKRKGGWCAQVRRKGYASRNKTFLTKSAATAWAREQEALIDMGRLPRSVAPLREAKLSDIISRYLREITPRKRSQQSEALRLCKIQRDRIAERKLIDLSSNDVSSYRDRRLQQVKPSTVRKELYLLASVIDVATESWAYPFSQNVVRQVSFPIVNDARNRRLEAGEMAQLERALAVVRNPWVRPIVRLAIETGLRRREIIELAWRNIDTEGRTAYIPSTKTGVPRTIPLTDQALSIISELERSRKSRVEANGQDRLFPTTVGAFQQAWRRVQLRSGIANLRFHDLRHEALSRFCELGLNVPELAVISGHRDPRMLFRYVHLRPDDLARRLAGQEWVAPST